MNKEQLAERITGAIGKFIANQSEQGKRGRKWKAVKLFSVDRHEPQREWMDIEPYKTRKSV